MHHKITILTVVYNDKTGLKSTIASVANQTYKNIEYIIVDGKSTDGTLEVIAENDYKITKWISEPDKGLYDAMNKGQKLASGDYIMFFNAGDTFLDDHALERIFEKKYSENEIVFGNVILTNNRFQWKNGAPYKKGSNKLTFHHQGIFFPRNYYTIEEYDISFKLVAETDYILRAFAKYDPVYVDIDILLSILEGWGVRQLKTFNGLNWVINEHLRLYDFHPNIYSKYDKFTLYPRFISKFLMYKMGGLELLSFFIGLRIKLSKLFK
jgi:glycosyltransferase involved in cell wall biosynthesis